MKLVTDNRKARHDYEILETFQVGIELTGTEVKSLRAGKCNLKDSYAYIKKGEVFLYGMHISPYEHGNIFNVDPLRDRKLLLHKYEINKLIGKTKEKGLSLVPLKVYFNDRGKVKMDLALAKGKKLYDKRADLAKKDAKREVEREMKNRN